MLYGEILLENGIEFHEVSYEGSATYGFPDALIEPDPDTSYETSGNPMPFSRSISPQSTRRAQRLFKFFFSAFSANSAVNY